MRMTGCGPSQLQKRASLVQTIPNRLLHRLWALSQANASPMLFAAMLLLLGGAVTSLRRRELGHFRQARKHQVRGVNPLHGAI